MRCRCPSRLRYEALTGLNPEGRQSGRFCSHLRFRPAMYGPSLPELAFRKADRQNSPAGPLAKRHSGTIAMKQIRAYPLESEADLARVAFEGADIPAIVVGVGIGMKGGVLLVREDRIDAALKVLKALEGPQ